MYKKISYLVIIAIGVFFVSCDKTMDDVYADLDAARAPLHKDVVYTLTAADYTTISNAALKDATNKNDSALARAVNTTKTLNSFATADKYVPTILSKAFPALNKNSTAQVSYGYTQDYLATLASAATYMLQPADYESVWGDGSTDYFLAPSNPPATAIPAILKANNPTAATGDVLLISYKYSDIDPSVSGTRLSEDFSSYVAATSPYPVIDANGWNCIAASGTKFWQARAYSGNNYAQISAYSSATATQEPENTVYMISPYVNLTQTNNNKFSFDIVTGNYNATCLKIKISKNYTGNVATATWDDVTSNFTIPTPASGYSVWASAGTLDLAAYSSEKKLTIAFVYEGGYANTVRTTTYQIDNILVEGTPKQSGSGPEPNPQPYNAIYTYGTSTWAPYPNAVILNPADYTAMGLTTTLSTTAAPNYLPTYLISLFPYAQEGVKKAAVYKSSGTTNAADEYIFTTGNWAPSATSALKTEQFIHTGTQWIFDPTVNLTMVNTDYQIMCTYVLNDPVLHVYQRGTYTNEEWYYGFSAYYANVNFRLKGSATSSRDVPCSLQNDHELHDLNTDKEMIDLLWKRLNEEGMIKFLQLKYPNSPVDVQGIPLYYNITAKIFYPDGVTNTTLSYTFKYKVLTAGSTGVPPTFEFISVTQQ